MEIIFLNEKTNEVLGKSDDANILSAIFTPHAQIQIAGNCETFHCKFLYNVVKTFEKEIEIYLEVEEVTKKNNQGD